MSMHRIVLIIAVTLLIGNCMTIYADQPKDEKQLIAALKSEASLQEKDAACAQLKRMGTAQSIPALAALLTDPRLAHSARYALESMPAPEAATALVAAMATTTGTLKAGIIHSLAQRREIAAEGIMTASLDDKDTTVSVAAAFALGGLTSPQATQSLLNVLKDASNVQLSIAVQDSLLAHADRLISEEHMQEAAVICDALLAAPIPDHVKAAAYRARILASQDDAALELTLAGLKSVKGFERQGALLIAAHLTSPEATKKLCEVLPALPDAALRTALILALHVRGDSAAAPVIMSATSDSDSGVRSVAIAALGDLAGSKAVPVLAKATSAESEEERRAARQSLAILRGANVTDALIDQLTDASPQARRTLVRVLAERNDPATSDKLISLVQKGTGPAIPSALQALSQVARSGDIGKIVDLIKQAQQPQTRNHIAEALLKACQQLRASGKEFDPEPIVTATTGSDPELRIVLLPLTSSLDDTRLHKVLRNSMKSTNDSEKSAAMKALNNARDFALLPDLLSVVDSTRDEKVRLQSIQAALRLATDKATSVSSEERVAALEMIMPSATRPDEKWALLAGLAESPSPTSLKLATSLLDEPQAKAEARQAVITIAAAIHKDHPESSRAALAKALEVAEDVDQRRVITAIMDQVSTSSNPQ